LAAAMREADRRKIEEVAEVLMDSILAFSRRVARESAHPGGKKFNPSRFVLKKVEELGPVRMSELGRHMEISKPYMTCIVDMLIDEGLVERVYDPRDRRVVKIRITGAGRDVLREFTEAVRASIVRRLSSLSSEDVSSLLESMQDANRILSKLDATGQSNPRRP